MVRKKLQRNVRNSVNGAENKEKVTSKSTPNPADESIDDFDDILAIIGAKGRYQKFLLYLIVSPTIALIPLVGFNAIFIHGELDHWCYAPGIESFNETELNTWKINSLPIETGPDGNPRLSQCQIYNDSLLFRNASVDDVNKANNNYTTTRKTTSRSRIKIDCPFGWSYNRTDLNSTIISDYDWVCSRNGYLTLLYTISSIGGLIGNFIFGPLADKFGRRLIYLIGFIQSLLFGFLGLFTAQHYALYVTFNFISSLGATGELLFLLLAELCDDEFRSWSCSFTAAVWVFGMCATPYIAYFARNWFIIGLATYTPCFILLALLWFLPESPRWLISVGRLQEASKIIKQIAKTNGTESYIEDDEKLKLALESLVKRQQSGNNNRMSMNMISVKTASEESSSTSIQLPRFWNLFTKFNVLKITFLLTIESIGSGMLYSGITLNTPNLAGDQFFNFFLLALIEFPSSFLAGYLVGNLGRRWTLVFSYLISGLACFIAAVAIIGGDVRFNIIVTIAMIITKFTINITFVGKSLQQTELYPTPFRSTGASMIAVTSGIVSLFTPSMVYLGKYYASGPYFAMGGLSLASTIAASFLPETLNQTLPETLEQSNEFGKYDVFWSFKPKKPNRSIKYGSLKKTPTTM